MELDMVSVGVYENRTLAAVDQGLLEVNGINSIISGDDGGGMYPFPISPVYGVRLLVAQKDFLKAKELLNSKS